MTRYILFLSQLCACLLVFSTVKLQAQAYGGFKAGINFSNFDGPSVLDANGNELENYKYSTGFHIGASVSYNVTDYFGFRGEVIYGQKGTEYDFNGDSFFPFYFEDGTNTLFGEGNRNAIFTITNTYLEIPLSAFVRFRRLELSGGLSFGFLVSSRAAGEVVFSNGVSPQGANIDRVLVIVDGSYFDSDPFDPNIAGQVEIRNIDGRRVFVPEVVGTYYENQNPDKSLFNRLDASIQGGASFYLNQGLFLSFKVFYGLSDITRNEEDFSVASLNSDNSLIFSDDKDRNITLQASVGFHF